MMTDYGITATGFVLKPLDVIKAEIEAEQRSEISPAIDQTADGVIGQLNGIFSSKLAEAWELLQAVYASQYPNSAAGIPLDNVASLTGAERLPATKSTAFAVATGTPGTILPEGRVVSVDEAGDRFVTLFEVTIGLGGTVGIELQSEEYGPIRANADTLTEIETPVAGWDSVTNAEDATLGRDLESDEAFRTRRALILSLPGDATVDAIRSQILDVDNVTYASVYENVTEQTDADGLPPKSIEVVVEGGEAIEVAQAILDSKAAGIRAYGVSDFQTLPDQQGTSHFIDLTYPAEKEVETHVEILFEDNVPEAEKADRLAAIVQALADYLDSLQVGEDVVRSRLFAPIYAAVEGIADVVVLQLAFVGDPLGTANLTVTKRQRASGDTADQDVVEA